MNLRLIVTILVIAAAPVCAQAQKPTPAKVTKADAQKVLKIISSDKAKTRIYCQMAKLGDQMEQANETGDSKKFDALFQKMYELGKTTGSLTRSGHFDALIPLLAANAGARHVQLHLFHARRRIG